MHYEIRVSDEMRYRTAGDYFVEAGVDVIEVYEQGEDDKNFAIAIHELVEHYLCKKRGISNKMIDDFDFSYEDNRHPDDKDSEPGDDPHCPYKEEHRFATIIEQMVCHELGVDWQDHDKNIKVYEPTA